MTRLEKIDRLVESIHASDIYGCFIEMGCGVTVANALMGVTGATKTVYMTESPYAREYQHGAYGNQEFRAVSVDCVRKVHDTLSDCDEFNSDIINTKFIASFQLGDETSNKSTHGWIAYSYCGNLKFYHVSVHDKMTRKEYLEEISLCALTIIRAKNECVIQDARIDIVDGFKDNDLELYSMIGETVDENFLCVRDGKFYRMEDFFRGKDNILLFKGSFNPIHHAHIEITQAMEIRYGEKPKLMISAEIYGKGSVNPTDMRNRVEDLNNLGYDVIVARSGFFDQNILHIRKKFDQPIIFGMGSDTLIRIFQSSYVVLDNDLNACGNLRHNYNRFKQHFESAKLFVVVRPGYDIPDSLLNEPQIFDRLEIHNGMLSTGSISSTQIRNGENLDMIPEKIRHKYMKH